MKFISIKLDSNKNTNLNKVAAKKANKLYFLFF